MTPIMQIIHDARVYAEKNCDFLMRNHLDQVTRLLMERLKREEMEEVMRCGECKATYSPSVMARGNPSDGNPEGFTGLCTVCQTMVDIDERDHYS